MTDDQAAVAPILATNELGEPLRHQTHELLSEVTAEEWDLKSVMIKT